MLAQIKYHMSPFLLTLFLFMCASPGKLSHSKSQTQCLKCDLEVLKLTSETVENLTSSRIRDFLCTIDESCVNSAEFSEVSNELLFEIFLREPKLSLEILNNRPNQSIDFILKELSEPIHDGIDLERVYSNVSQVKGHKELKGRVMKSIQQAISKY